MTMALRESEHVLERRKAVTRADVEINQAINDAYDKHTLSEAELLLILSNKIGQMARWAIRQDNASDFEDCEHGFSRFSCTTCGISDNGSHEGNDATS